MIRRSTRRSQRAQTIARRRGRTAPRPPRPSDERLAGTGHPHLAPVGWALGRPVRDFLIDGPLPTGEAVAVSLAVLSALAGLHRAGRIHGGVSEDSVGVASDGWVRLAAEAAGDDRRGRAGDLSDTGLLLCRLLGAGPQDTPNLPSSEAEKTAPALVAVARSLARGDRPWSAEEAWAVLKEAAGYWGSEPQLVHALAALSDRVEGASPIERAVTKIVIGPPLRAEPPPELKEPRSFALPELGLSRLLELRPSLPAMSLPTLPPLAAPPRPGRRFVTLAIIALLAGLLIGAATGARAALRPRETAAAAPAKPKQAAVSPAAPRPEGLYAQTPSAAVSMFFQLVQEQKLDQAALLWKAKMASEVDLVTRFSGITNIDLRRADTTAEDDSAGIATVAVDWVETEADGSTHEYSGVVYADTGPVLWRWDSWTVQEVAQGGSGSESEGG